MTKLLNATLIVGSNRQPISLSLPDELVDKINEKQYTVELVQLDGTTHSVYIIHGDTDIVSVTFNPVLKDSVKDAFKTIRDKLFSAE